MTIDECLLRNLTDGPAVEHVLVAPPPTAVHSPVSGRNDAVDPCAPAMSLAQVAASLDQVARAFDVETISTAGAERLVPIVAAMARQVDAVLALLGARVAEAATTDRAAKRWLSQATGESGLEAHRRIVTGQVTRHANGVRTAALAGALSTETARAIGAAVQVEPGAEGRLLELAANGSAEDVRREARRVATRARDETEDERQARQHAARHLVFGEDDDGATAGRFKTTNAHWAPVKARLEIFTQAAFARAHRSGERSPRSAYAMDRLALMAHVAAGGHPSELGYERDDLPAALARLLDHVHGCVAECDEPTADDGASDPSPRGGPDPGDVGSARPGGTGTDGGRVAPPAASAGAGRAGRRTDRPRRGDTDGSLAGLAHPDPPVPPAPGPPKVVADKVIVRVDLAALRRGRGVGGETCDIAGVGAVPVEVARAALGDAFLALIVTDGHDVINVAHAGRRADAWQRTALEWRFDECATQGCHSAGYRGQRVGVPGVGERSGAGSPVLSAASALVGRGGPTRFVADLHPGHAELVHALSELLCRRAEPVAGRLHQRRQGVDGQAGLLEGGWLHAQLDGGKVVEAHGVVGHHRLGGGLGDALLGEGHLGDGRLGLLALLGRQRVQVDPGGGGRLGEVVRCQPGLTVGPTRRAGTTALGRRALGLGLRAVPLDRYLAARGPQAHVVASKGGIVGRRGPSHHPQGVTGRPRRVELVL